MPLIANAAELRRRRELAGMTQDEFAKQAGYTATHVSQVEREVNNAGGRYLRAAARIFGCGIEDLTSGFRPRRRPKTAAPAAKAPGNAA